MDDSADSLAGIVDHFLRTHYGTLALGLYEREATPLANLALFWGALPQAFLYLYFAAGVAGFFLRKADVPLGPLVLGLILGPMLESNLRRALILSRGDWLGTLTRPITLFFLVATLASLAWPILQARFRRQP